MSNARCKTMTPCPERELKARQIEEETMVSKNIPHETAELNTRTEGLTAERTMPPLEKARAETFILRLARECRVKPYPDGWVTHCTCTLNAQLYDQGWSWFGWSQEIVDAAINNAAVLNLITLKPLVSGIQIEIPEGYDGDYDECKAL